MSVREWWKIVFLDEKFYLDGLDGFQKYWHAKIFLEENYSRMHSGGGSLMIWGTFLFSGKLKLQFVSGQQKAADHVKMINDLSLTQVVHHLCGEEWIFQRDNAAIHNASITKKYLLLDHPACFPDFNSIENL